MVGHLDMDRAAVVVHFILHPEAEGIAIEGDGGRRVVPAAGARGLRPRGGGGRDVVPRGGQRGVYVGAIGGAAGAAGARSSMTVPLKFQDEVIGTLNVESPRVNGFGPDDLQFTELFSREVAAAPMSKVSDRRTGSALMSSGSGVAGPECRASCTKPTATGGRFACFSL